MNFIYRLVLCACMGLVFTYATANAQWKGDGTQRTEAGVPYEPLVTLPELHSDMPLDCMVAYIVMDSVARTFDDPELVESYPQTTSLDSLQVLSRFYYAAVDYDPLLLSRYFTHSGQAIEEGSKDDYLTHPRELYNAVRKAIRANRHVPPTYESYDLKLLLLADYIVKVRVFEIVRGIDTTYPSPLPWVNYACEVLDSIKGMHLPNSCDPAFYLPAARKNESTDQTPAPPPGHCLIFGHKSPQYSGQLSSWPEQESGNIVEPEVGDVAYVFLTVGQDFNTLSIRPLNEYDKTGGVFLVKDGKVLDSGNFWGLGYEPDEAEFLQNIQTKITEIKSWWIHQ